MEIKFTSQKPEYIELPHPVPAKKHIPDWYKNMSRFMGVPRKLDATSNNGVLEKSLTIKACVPVLDFFTSGYIIPLWQDVLVERELSGGLKFNWPDGDVPLIGEHPKAQVKESPFEKESDGTAIYKFLCPWRFKTPPGYSCFFFSPFYHRTDLEILPAIVDTDGMAEVNFPFLYKGQGRENLYSSGTPLIQVLPFKRDDWTHTVEEGSELETRKVKTMFFQSFSKAYKERFHKKKVFL